MKRFFDVAEPVDFGSLTPVIHTERGRVRESSEQTIRRIKENFFRGDYQGPAGAAIVELMELAENPITHLDKRVPGEVDLLKETITCIDARYEALRQAFPPPECEDCTCEMSMENHGNQDFYVCGYCFEGTGCSCFQSAPCGWCEHIIIADDWMLEHSSEYRAEKRAEKNQAKHLARENGPSASAAAKPVTKLIIGCQGDWSPWGENL